MSRTFKLLISNWPRRRKFNRLLHAAKAIAFDFSHHTHALITLYVQFSCSDWPKFDGWIHAENLCSVWKLAWFSWLSFVSSSDVFNCLFLLDIQNEIRLLSRSVIHGWFVYCAFAWEMHRLSKSLEIRFRMASFSKMRLLTCICLRHKKVEKSRAILGHLMTFRSCILTGKREQLLSLMCFFFQFPEVERMVYAA